MNEEEQVVVTIADHQVRVDRYRWRLVSSALHQRDRTLLGELVNRTQLDLMVWWAGDARAQEIARQLCHRRGRADSALAEGGGAVGIELTGARALSAPFSPARLMRLVLAARDHRDAAHPPQPQEEAAAPEVEARPAPPAPPPLPEQAVEPPPPPAVSEAPPPEVEREPVASRRLSRLRLLVGARLSRRRGLGGKEDYEADPEARRQAAEAAARTWWSGSD